MAKRQADLFPQEPKVVWEPLPEDEAPSVDAVVEVAIRLEDRLRAGEKVRAIACWEGNTLFSTGPLKRDFRVSDVQQDPQGRTCRPLSTVEYMSLGRAGTIYAASAKTVSMRVHWLHGDQ